MAYYREAGGWFDVGVLLQEFHSRYKIPIDQHAGPHRIDAFEQSLSGVIVLGRGSEVPIHSFACRRANTIGPHQHVRKSTRTVGEMKGYFPSLGINIVGCELLGCVDFARSRNMPQEELYHVLSVDRYHPTCKIHAYKKGQSFYASH